MARCGIEGGREEVAGWSWVEEQRGGRGECRPQEGVREESWAGGFQMRGATDGTLSGLCEGFSRKERAGMGGSRVDKSAWGD
jgi:hypothetical protein